MSSRPDQRILYLSAFLRALATGMMGVLLGIHLAKLEFSGAQIGLVIGFGLTGVALSTLVVTFLGDRLGRRRALLALALLASAGGFAFVLVSQPVAVCAVAFLGMLNGMGRDRAGALVLEHAALPATTTPRERTRAFAWYNVLQDIGHALGGLMAALPVLLREATGAGEAVSFQFAIGLYALMHLANAVLYLRLSPDIEVGTGMPTAPMARLSPESRTVLVRISSLFAVDSLAGGFLGTALLSYFFFERFGAPESAVATLFFLARIANALSHLGAARLARRFGLVNTMVFTHIPSSLILVAVALVPDFWIAAVLFLVRETLVEMDVPTRQSYVMAVVRPEERTFASGITSLVRVSGWAAAPFVAGALMQGVALATPLLLGAGLKIGYDLMLWRSFRDLRPPEERPAPG